MSFELFQLVMVLYWLALATWFGSVLFIALAAPVVFRTVRESDPTLPTVLSVNLEGQHGTLLAGTIVANLLQRLSQLQLICAAVLAVLLVLQVFAVDLRDTNLAAALLRTAMFLGALGVVLYDRFVVWPRMIRQREVYIDNADDPDVANPAKDAFDRDHRTSVSLLSIILFLLLGMILFSANVTPKGYDVPAGPDAPLAPREP